MVELVPAALDAVMIAKALAEQVASSPHESSDMRVMRKFRMSLRSSGATPADLGGPTMFAQIGMMHALNHHADRVFNPDRKDTRLGKRKLKRDQ